MNSKPAKIDAISTDKGLLTVWLTDGRILSLPLAWYPSLGKATAAERELWQPSGAGRGIHWPALDYDLSVEGLLEGRHEHPSAARYVEKSHQPTQSAKPLALPPACRKKLRRRRSTKSQKTAA